jgi:hypothetical protein
VLNSKHSTCTYFSIKDKDKDLTISTQVSETSIPLKEIIFLVYIMASISSLCTPAFIYVVIAIISLLFSIGTSSVMSLIVQGFFVLLWTWFLNFLCSKGYTGISWFLVIIPYVLGFLVFLFAYDVIANAAKNGDIAPSAGPPPPAGPPPAAGPPPPPAGGMPPPPSANKEGFYRYY